CSPPGSPWAGGEAMYDPQFPNLPNTRNLSDDGSTIAFTSRAPLLPADINGGKDVYEWRNGRLSLVTDGSKEFSSLNLIGMSANATDVYFMAGGPRLTGFEVDRNVQLYDARVGGGFTPPAPPAECVEDACQGPLEPSPSLQGSGSASFAGPGNQSAANPRKRCGKNRQKKSKSKARCGKKRQEKQGQKKRNSNRRGG
ncbi:MAG TPA: hypothetical protein VFX85_10175, partial [Solirubrobacterales bacterium]|nr:hypothetical protein [Solirubrobacterales bacterium]